ncbi:hypothetical protein AB0P12_06800 [Streptomyces subrutilus]|uniref:hypothetical protein n=1 Tax=Streptomyces subrutilus TaxID=36818 RepID=UPI00341B17C1
MPHEHTHPAAPGPVRYGDAILTPTTVPDPRMLPAEIPAGVEMVTLPNGYRTLAYTQHPALAAAPAAQPVPVWAKATAILAPTVGGGIAAAGFGISYAAPGLIAMADALWAAMALIAAGTLAPALLRAGRGSGGRGRAPVQHVTQNISASGMFGRATGTLNNR